MGGPGALRRSTRPAQTGRDESKTAANMPRAKAHEKPNMKKKKETERVKWTSSLTFQVVIEGLVLFLLHLVRLGGPGGLSMSIVPRPKSMSMPMQKHRWRQQNKSETEEPRAVGVLLTFSEEPATAEVSHSSLFSSLDLNRTVPPQQRQE